MAEAEPPKDTAPAGTAQAGEPSTADRAKAMAAQKAAAAAGAAKDAAKKGLAVIQGLGLKLRGLAVSILLLPLLLFRGDLMTRILMVGLLASIGLLVMTGGQLYRRFLADLKVKPEKTEMGQGLAAFLQAQKDMTVAAANMVFLERFSASLRSESGAVRSLELEIYVESDKPETGNLLKSRLPEIREMVSAAIQGQAYDRLMTEEGKLAFRQQIAETITRGIHKWKSKGSVKSVFFTKFVMG